MVTVTSDTAWVPVPPTDTIPLPPEAFSKALIAKPDQCVMPPLYEFKEFTTLTDASGHYSLNVPSGYLNLSAWAEGYIGAWDSFSVKPDQTVEKSYQIQEWTDDTPIPDEPPHYRTTRQAQVGAECPTQRAARESGSLAFRGEARGNAEVPGPPPAIARRPPNARPTAPTPWGGPVARGRIRGRGGGMCACWIPKQEVELMYLQGCRLRLLALTATTRPGPPGAGGGEPEGDR